MGWICMDHIHPIVVNTLLSTVWYDPPDDGDHEWEDRGCQCSPGGRS